MADQTGLSPVILRQWVGGKWIALAPLTRAGQVILPDGTTLLDHVTGEEPDQELVTITHNLDGYPLVLLLALQFGAGMSGAGIGPAGGTSPVQYPCRAVYHDRHSLTVYTIKAITDVDTDRTLTKTGPCEYTLTFGSVSADSLYVKLVLTMGPMAPQYPLSCI